MAVGTNQIGSAAETYAHWQTLLASLTSTESDGPLAEMLHSIAGSVRDIVGCGYAVISVVDENGSLEHFIPVGVDQPSVERIGRPPVRGGLLGTVLNDPETVRVSDIGVDPRSAGRPADHPAIKALLGVPIRYDDQTVGGLYLSGPADGETFSAADQQVCELIASTAAAVIKRNRLARAYEQRQRWLTESAELTRTLLSGEHIDPMRLVVERALDIADADLVAVVTEQPDAHSFAVIQAAGTHGARVLGRIIDAKNTFAATVIADGLPRVVDHLSDSGRHSDLVRLIGADAAVLVPLTGPGGERAMLAVFRRVDQAAFTSADVEATTMFAAQMTLAMQLAESRAHRERVALLDERDRIARDLHDHVIQRLFAIGLTVQSAGTQVDGDTAQRLLASVEDIDETIGQIRSSIYRLTGPILSADSSIRVKVARLIEEMEPVLGFRADLDVQGPIDFGVDGEVTHDCVAVLREALTNVARHAFATRVEVSVSVTSSTLTLGVTDNGRGIGPNTRRSGLANLRTRAERRRGRLTVASGGSLGTRLTWRIPIGTDSDIGPEAVQPAS
jgi:signal transduction histidine kinase